MKLYIKYFKKYWLLILITLACITGQVSTVLALPKYMANMIDVGIQQKGIQTYVYEKIDQPTYEMMNLITTSDEKAVFDSSYELKDNVYTLTKSSTELENLTLKLNNVVIKEFSNETQRAQFLSNNNLESLAQLQTLSDAEKTNLFANYQVSKDDSTVKMMQANMIYNKNQELGVADTSLAYVTSKGLEMLLVAVSGMIFVIGSCYFAAKFAAKAASDIRKEVFAKIESFSEYEFEQFSTASLITRTINDTNQIQQSVGMVVRIGFMSPIVAIGAFLQSTTTNMDLIWIIGLGVVTFVVIMVYVLTVLLAKFELFQKLYDKTNLVLRENLSGLRVIRAFNTEAIQDKKFETVNSEMLKNNREISGVIALINPSLQFVTNISTVLIVFFGAPLVAASSLQIGGLLSFIQFSTQVMFSFMMVGFLFFVVPRITISLKRIDEVMTSVNILQDPKVSVSGDHSNTVEFKNVSFSYGGDSIPAIENLSFKAEPGKIIAFIGGTGSGKSTIGKLIKRFYDVTQGEILVDGENIKNYKQADLRNKIGYVPQKGQVFSRSIKENIAYGSDHINQDLVERAARIACAEEFVQSKENGYDYVLEQRGSNLSGGQKQRIQIARAIYKGANILFFDDSFSALDYKTDVALRSNLHREMKDATILIVAQRIPTIMHADEIIVLDEGKVVGRGKHEDLLATCSVYQDIAASQIERGEE